MDELDRYLGGFIGLAIGDAIGTTVETKPPHAVAKNPVTDMVGGGKYSLQPESSKTTHFSQVAIDCCKFYRGIIIGALKGVTKDILLSELYHPIEGYWKNNKLHEDVKQVASGSFNTKNPPEIVNSGYSLLAMEAALWAFYHSTNYKDGLLKVVNLGDDADTVGAIYGMLAGTYYGIQNIPLEWRQKLALYPVFEVYANELYKYSKNLLLKKEIPEKSQTFITCQQLMKFLEEEYENIMKRVDPSPKRYKSMEEFEKDVLKFKTKYEEEFKKLENEKLVQALWNEFEKRLNHDRETLSDTLNRQNAFTAIKGGLLKQLHFYSEK